MKRELTGKLNFNSMGMFRPYILALEINSKSSVISKSSAQNFIKGSFHRLSSRKRKYNIGLQLHTASFQ